MTLNLVVLLVAGSCHAHPSSENIHAWAILAGLYSCLHLYLVVQDCVSGVDISQESDSEVVLHSCQHREHNCLRLKAVYDLCEVVIGLFDRRRFGAETVQIFRTVGRSHLPWGDLARRICIRNKLASTTT